MLCRIVSTAETSEEDVPPPLNNNTVGDALARIPACAGATESCCVETPDWFGIPQPIKLIDATKATLKMRLFRKDFAMGEKRKGPPSAPGTGCSAGVRQNRQHT
jgi:hypothetical protein